MWDDDDALDAFLGESAVARRWQTVADEYWHVRLEPLRARGTWGRHEVFPDALGSDHDGPVAELTCINVQSRAQVRFWRTAIAVGAELSSQPGFLAGVSGTEPLPPLCRNTTFSLWRSLEDASSFVNGSPRSRHAEAVRNMYEEHWASEFLVARFRPYATFGTWDGRDPLAALASGHFSATRPARYSATQGRLLGRRLPGQGRRAIGDQEDGGAGLMAEPRPTKTSDVDALPQLRAAIRSVASRTVELVSGAKLDHRVPRSQWTARETAAHLVVVFRLYSEAVAEHERRWIDRYVSGPDDTRARLAAGNARSLAQVPRDDAARLGADISQAVGAFLALLSGRPWQTTVPTPWYGDGQSRPLGLVGCLALGELLIHGYDVARALGQPWPIEPSHARLAIAGMMSMIPRYVNGDTARGLRASYLVHVRGGQRVFVRFDDGVATVGTSRGQIDCHLSVDPVAFLLVGYGRLGQWAPIAKGQLVAWGRKPWLGLRFKRLVLDP